MDKVKFLAELVEDAARIRMEMETLRENMELYLGELSYASGGWYEQRAYSSITMAIDDTENVEGYFELSESHLKEAQDLMNRRNEE